MADSKKELQGLFGDANRHANFGEAVMRIHVQGFRCHPNTRVEVQSPITAFCGLNGTGKSTLLQLASAAYNGEYRGARFYIKQFIIRGTLDQNPIQNGATVVYEYQQAPGARPADTQYKKVTVKRKSNWTGYHRQPIRKVFYGSVGFFLPRVDERDLVTLYSNSLTVHASADLTAETRQKIGRILGTSYAESKNHRVDAAGRKRDLLSVGRDGANYSEINMGFGEGRICRLISALESLPNKSLILLEEPEISLHPSAQHELGRYLVELCIAKRHQVFLTTHSEYLMQAFPERSRVYLHKSATGIAVLPGISVGQATSLLSGQFKTAIHILVEDDVAEHIVTELLRKFDPVFLKTVHFTRVGSKQDIQTVMKSVREMGIPACAVRDADAGANPKENLFKLWGDTPPEKEVFLTAGFRQMLLEKFGLNLDEINLQLAAKDHHDWFKELARLIPCAYEALLQISAEAYLSSVSEAERSSLVAQIKAAVK